MIAQETHLMIKHMAQERVPKADIARHFGISRQTVYNRLNRDSYRKRRAPRPSKLDPYEDYILARLERFDLPATVLLRELRERGYDGGITILRERIAPLKAAKVRQLTERFETIPGQQAQIDWGECGMIEVDGKRRKLYVFVMVLGYSRMLFARFTTSTKRHVLLGCLREGFERLGLPKEILLDNMKQAVDLHNQEGVRFNAEFLDFCEHHGVLPIASPPYWPRIKGKVERGVGYVKTSFLEGRCFTDLDDLNAQLDHWLATVANIRCHGTTGDRPCDRHQQELDYLRPLAAVPAYDTRPQQVRKVASDSHISYRGVRYSIDPRAANQSVTVRPTGERIGDRFMVYHAGELVAEHTLRPPGSPRVTLAEHAAEIRRLCRRGTPNKPGNVRFEQSPGTPTFTHLGDSQIPAPKVEERSLELYERLLAGGTA